MSWKRITLIASCLLMSIACVAMLACTSTQGREGTHVVKEAAKLVAIPGVNSQALVEYLQGVEDRFATLENRKPEEKTSWQDLLYAFFGGGGASVAAAAALDSRSSKKRSKSRLETLSPLIQVIDQLAEAHGATLPQAQRDLLATRVSAAKQKLAKEAA